MTNHRVYIDQALTQMLENSSTVEHPIPEVVAPRAKPLPPFLKWPGGKRSLADKITPFFSSISGRYFEPFLGGGAIFFRLAHRPAFLSDSNTELINCYTVVRDNLGDLLSELSLMKNSKDEYYKIRQTLEFEPVKRAARFIYLTALSFNGIYRLNLQGLFNVPYGYREKRNHFAEEDLRAASSALAGVELNSSDFVDAVGYAKKGDGVYFDPPYTVAHENNGFVKYNDKIFSWEDQIRLRDTALELIQKGCIVVISNANHSSLRKLYKDFKVKTVRRPSVIAASGSHRGEISECIFYGA